MNGESDPNEVGVNVNMPDESVAPATPEANAAPVVGYCRICGRGLPEAEVRRAAGVIYCTSHAPAAPPPPPPPPDSDWAQGTTDTSGSVSPGLAFVLGLIPGVGAIYNGQYAKGLVHVVVFGLIISILEAGASGMTTLFAFLLTGWVFYMPFEAFHTAKKRQSGERVDEFSSLIPLKGQAGSKVGPIVLIAGGVFFLLINLDVIELYQVVRFWPVLLIALGGWLLYSRRGSEEAQ
jgi:TM2 domain-containing membrane protein YozV